MTGCEYWSDPATGEEWCYTHKDEGMPREDWCPEEFEWNGWEVKEGSDSACFRYVSCDRMNELDPGMSYYTEMYVSADCDKCK